MLLPLLSLGNSNLKKVTLQLAWYNQFQFAGYYMAKEKGFYKDVGLDVDLQEYHADMNIAKNVSEGHVDFGIGKEELIVEKINNYKNLVALYPLFQASPLILASKKQSYLNSIAQLKDKKVMLTKNDLSQASLKAMIKSEHVNVDSITFVPHTHSLNDFLNNNVDVVSGYISKLPHTLMALNVDVNIFSPKDFGFEMYSDFLFTNNELVKKDFEKVVAFKEASLKGWEYAYNNIEESVNVILEKYNTQNLSKKELLFEANELKKLSYYGTTTLGKFSKSKVDQMYAIYNVIGDIYNKSEVLDFMFDEEIGALSKEEHAFLQRKESIKMCVQSNNLPYEDIVNDKATGILSEYITLIEQKLNKKIKLIAIPNTPKQSIDFLLQKKCDVISFMQQQDVSNEILLTKPYLKLPFVFVSHRINSLITNFESLQGKKIFVSTKNYGIVDYIDKLHSSIFMYPSPTSDFAFKQIASDKADGYIGNIAEVIYDLNREKNTNLNITGKFDNKMYVHFGTLKEDVILRDIFNKVLEDIPQKQHDYLLNNYTVLNYSETIDYKLLLFAGFIIVLLIIFYIRENKLKNKIKQFNDELQQRIIDESIKNRKKDEALFKKAKLASMGNMINNIAHQWRQPLNRVNLSIQIIETLINKDSVELLHQNIIDKKFSSIHTNIKYMSTTIEDFIHFFHPNKDRNEINLLTLFKETVSLVKIRDESICFQIMCEDDITIVNFENEIIQVMIVILENAIDNFEVTKMKNKSIQIEAKNNEDEILISIKDNSGGISHNIINKIFEPYFTTKYEREGSGIGLYMAKILVEDSIGGHLDVESENIFTTFKISIPKEFE